MKEDKHLIDNFFREGIENFEAMPPPIVWEQVQANLPQRKRRLLPIFWLCSTLGIGFAIGAFIMSPKAYFQKQELAKTSVLNIVATNDNSSNKAAVVLDKNTNKNNFAFAKKAKPFFFTPKKADFLPNKTNISLENQKIEIEEPTTRATENISELPMNPIPNVEYKHTIQFKKQDKSECYSFGKENWNQSVEFYVGGEYSNPMFKTKGTEPANYAKSRKDSEKYILGGDIGIWYNPVHRSGFGIRTGLHASRYIENFDVANAFEERYVVNTVQIKDAQGQVIKTETVTTLVRGRYIQKYYNHFTAIDIPLQVGFEFLKQRNTQYYAYVGGLLNLRFWSNGDILDASGKVISFPDKVDVYRNQTNLSLLGHIGMRHRIANNWWLTTALQSNYTMGDITLKANPLSQKNLKAGLQVGLRYQF